MQDLYFASSIFVVLLVFPSLVDIRGFLAQLKRLKWFFLSILLLYLWFTPGQSITTWIPYISPTIEGIKLALARIFALTLMVFALHVFVKSIERDQLIVAVLWWLKPLLWLGLPQQSLAIRISLVMQLIEDVQVICTDVTKRDGSIKYHSILKTESVILQKIDAVAERITAIIATVINNAINMPVQKVKPLSSNQAPPIYQWLFPALMLSIFMFTGNL